MARPDIGHEPGLTGRTGCPSARSRVNITANKPPMTIPAMDIAFAIGPEPCVPAIA